MEGFLVSVIDDGILENNESFSIQLSLTEINDSSIIVINPAMDTINIEITDDDGNYTVLWGLLAPLDYKDPSIIRTPYPSIIKSTPSTLHFDPVIIPEISRSTALHVHLTHWRT